MPTAVASSWRYAPRKGSKVRGAQIDLLFDRKDSAITICEIKYSEEPFTLTKDYVEFLKGKKRFLENKQEQINKYSLHLFRQTV